MQHVRIKSATGWEEKDLDAEELSAWFTEHSKDGIVTDEILLFSEAKFDVTKDSVSWVMSDMSLDRDMERVDPAGCDMKSYKKNPVVLWAHDHSTPAIGKCNNPKVKDGQVTGNIEFDSAQNDPFAGMIAGKVKAGIINAGSIGFKPNVVEFNEDSASKDPTRLIHRKWELMEFSICNVPANANARPMDGQNNSIEDTEQKESEKDIEIERLRIENEELKNGKKTWIAELLADHGKPSRDTKTESKTATVSIGAMFAGESSGDRKDGLGFFNRGDNNG